MIYQTDYLESVVQQFVYYKKIAEKTFAQLPDEMLFWQYNETSNSIAILVKHISGNMLSRWTDFLTSDGEKEWRNRDAEFESDIDILVDLDYTQHVGLNFVQMKLDLEEQLHKSIDLVPTEAISRHLLPFINKDKQLIYQSVKSSFQA